MRVKSLVLPLHSFIQCLFSDRVWSRKETSHEKSFGGEILTSESLVKNQTEVDTGRTSVELSRKRKACRAVTL